MFSQFLEIETIIAIHIFKVKFWIRRVLLKRRYKRLTYYDHSIYTIIQFIYYHKHHHENNQNSSIGKPGH